MGKYVLTSYQVSRLQSQACSQIVGQGMKSQNPWMRIQINHFTAHDETKKSPCRLDFTVILT